jgi:hypothetical protein
MLCTYQTEPVRESGEVGLTIRYHSSLERSKLPHRTMASLLGMLLDHGHPVKIAAVNDRAGGSLPFDRPAILERDPAKQGFSFKTTFNGPFNRKVHL